MSRPARPPFRACVAVLAALALVGCAQSGAVPTQTAPAAAETTTPSAAETTTPPAAPTATPPAAPASAAPSTTPTAPGAAEPDRQGHFESQDGAVRFELPAGWTVDDRSAMGEASEMHSRGPGWLNELVVLDEGGDQMLWYREGYGNDAVDCVPLEASAFELEIEPFAPEHRDRLRQDAAGAGTALIVGEVGETSRWEHDARAGEWSVVMGVVTRLPGGSECSSTTDALWTGSRVARIDVVADASTGEPDTTLGFADEQSARAWLESQEAQTVISVIASLRLGDVELLDAAP